MIDRIFAPFLAFAALIAAPIVLVLSSLYPTPSLSAGSTNTKGLPVIELERVLVIGKRVASSQPTSSARVAQADSAPTTADPQPHTAQAPRASRTRL